MANSSLSGTFTGSKNLVLLSTQTASASATIDFTSLITSNYANYMIIFEGVYPDVDLKNLRMQFSTDNGSTWLAGTTYRYNNERRNMYNTSVVSETSAGDSSILLTTTSSTLQIKNLSSQSAHGTLYLLGPNGTNKTFVTGTTFTGQTNSSKESVYGENTTTTPVNAIRFLMSANNIQGGTFKLYGIL